MAEINDRIPAWWAPQARISHSALGAGTVILVELNSGQPYSVVDFDQQGRKTLAIKVAQHCSTLLTPAPEGAEQDNGPLSLDQVMAATAAHAVHLARDKGLDLDFSVESLKKVEKFLADVHSRFPGGFFTRLWKERPSDAEIQSLSDAFGAYIAEVFKKSVGGHWSLKSDMAPGNEVPTFHFDSPTGGEIWPQFKVAKRLRNGAEDNVWHYAQFLIAQQSGTNQAPPNRV